MAGTESSDEGDSCVRLLEGGVPLPIAPKAQINHRVGAAGNDGEVRYAKVLGGEGSDGFEQRKGRYQGVVYRGPNCPNTE